MLQQQQETSARSRNGITGRGRECDRTHSDPAHSRGGRPRSGTSTSTVHERETSARMIRICAKTRALKGRSPALADGRCGLSHVEQFHLEHEAGIGGNRPVWGAHRAVSQIWRDDQPPLAANAHSLEPLIPPANDITGAKPERERLTPYRRIELLAFIVRPARVVQPPRIVDGQARAATCLETSARNEIGVRER